jgi:hypothetical protein
LGQTCVGVSSNVAHLFVGCDSGLSLSFGVSSGLGQELFEVLQQIRRSVEEVGDLRVDVLNGFGFSLISLKNLEKLLVDFRLLGESVLSRKLGDLPNKAEVK